MRKRTLLIFGSAILFSAVAAQDVIENRSAPLRANAGRIVTLKEEMRLEDTGQGFYFKNPNVIRVSPTGDVFIADGQEQALHFDANGRYVRNLLKKGQGPGELTTLLDIWATSDRLYLLGYPSKILIFNYDGSLDKELILKETGMMDKFIRINSDSIIIQRRGRPDPAEGSGFINVPQHVVEISMRDASTKAVGSFPIREFVQFFKGGVTGGTSWNQLQAVSFDENTLILNYTPEYLLETFIRDKGSVLRRFRRPYARLKRSAGGGGIRSGGSAPAPPEYQNDIFDLHVVDGKVWVQTSTVTEGKGILFDVFDAEGRYVDNFYLQASSRSPSGKSFNRTMTIANGFAYFRDKTEDDLIVIKKCRFVGL